MASFKLYAGLVLNLALGLSLTGCNKSTGFSTASQSASQTVANSPLSVVQDPLSCLITTPNFELRTRVDSFSLTGGGSANAGFSLNGILNAIGIDISYSTGELDMSMTMYAPLFGSQQLNTSTGRGKSSNFNFSASVLDGLIGGGLGFWSSTGLETLSVKALSNTYGNLAKNLPSSPWWTVISGGVGVNQFTIPVGETAGLLPGDKFNVYSVNYIWNNGAPCKVPLSNIYKLNNQKPIGVATVQQVDYDSAIVTVNNPTLPVLNYSKLEILSLVPAANGAQRTNLKYSLRLSDITQSNGLQFSDGRVTQTVDMTGFVSDDLSNYLVNSLGAFYLL